MKKFYIILILLLLINVNKSQSQTNKVNGFVDSYNTGEKVVFSVVNNPKIDSIEIVNELKTDTVNFLTDIIVSGQSEGTSEGKEVLLSYVKGKISNITPLFSKSQELTGLPNSRIDISNIKEGFYYNDKIWFPKKANKAFIICLENRIIGYNVLYCDLPFNLWESAIKKNDIDLFKFYIEKYPNGEHYQESLAKIEELSLQKCLKYENYFDLSQFIVDFPNSINIENIKNKLSKFKFSLFNHDTLLSREILIRKFHWNLNTDIIIIDNKGYKFIINGKEWLKGYFSFGNLSFKGCISVSNENIFIEKETGLIYKEPKITQLKKSPYIKKKK